MKKKGNIFKTLFIFSFIIYVVIYVLSKAGYYENQVRKNTLYTETQIKVFEEKISNNEIISQGQFLEEKKDYSNFITRSASRIVKGLSKVISDKKSGVIEVLKSLFIG